MAVSHPTSTTSTGTRNNDMGITNSIRDVLPPSNSININQATQVGPTPIHTFPSQSRAVTTKAAGIVETPYLDPTFTTDGNNGSTGNRRSNLNPVMISLVSVSGVILLIVSTILVIVFLLWRRRSRGSAKSRKPREETADSSSTPTAPTHPQERERSDSNSTFYHVLTEGHPRSLSQQVSNMPIAFHVTLHYM